MFHSPTSETQQQGDSPRTQLRQRPDFSAHAQLGYAPVRGQQQLARLHSTYGNQAVLRMLSQAAPGIQTKLAVNKPGDEFEQEADRMADQVMRMTAPAVQRKCSSCEEEEKVQRKCAECEEEEKKTGLQRREAGAGPQFAPPSVHSVLSSSGHALDPAMRAFMEPRFGHNFSGVRVHTDASAADSARAVNALAYTSGQHVVFGAGQYSPSNAEGQRLLAHELTHVVQQASRNTMVIQRKEPTQVEEAAWGEAHDGRIDEVGQPGDPSSNEFILWNFGVGSDALRPAHVGRLKSIASKWSGLLATRPDLRINVIGNASQSGTSDRNDALAAERAATVRKFLADHGVADDRMESSGQGSTMPLADSTSPENMARNRRVEVFAFVPTTEVKTLGPDVVPNVLQLDVTTTTDPDVSVDTQSNFYSERLRRAIQTSAKVTLSGPANSQIGFIQFLTKDVRQGTYKTSTATPAVVTLNYGRCTSPFLPCRDVEEATNVFSYVGSGFNTGPTSQPTLLSFRDSPGVIFPLRESVPGVGMVKLDHSSWSMEFALVLGVRQADQFLPLQHVLWGLSSDRDFSKSPPAGTPSVNQILSGSGSPSGLSIQTAMTLRTCRFLTRSMETPGHSPGACRPEISGP